MSRKNKKPTGMYRIICALLLFSSCTVLPPPGAIHWALHNPLLKTSTTATFSISLEDKNGLPMDNRYAHSYVTILLEKAGYYSNAGRISNLDISLREQAIENNMQGLLSVTAVLSATNSNGSSIARLVYLGRSPEGLKSDLLVYTILRKLIAKLMHESINFEGAHG